MVTGCSSSNANGHIVHPSGGVSIVETKATVAETKKEETAVATAAETKKRETAVSTATDSATVATSKTIETKTIAATATSTAKRSASPSESKKSTATPKQSKEPDATPTTEKPEYVIVPGVIGKNEAEAKKLMKEAGITVRIVYEFHAEHEKGYVFDPEFPKGHKLNPNASMLIWVSKGLTDPIVPNIIGMNYVKAKQKLLNACGTWKIEIAREKNDEPKDTVYKLNSAVTVGRGYPRDGVIWLYVSEGPDVIIVLPDVRGQDYKEAKHKIEALGLRFNVNFTADENVQKDKVITQSPGAGARINESDKDSITVTLIVSLGSPQPESSAP